MPTLPELLKTLVEMDGSDLHISIGTPPQVRVHGHLQRLQMPEMQPAETKQLVYSVLTDSQKKRFEESLELDFSFGIKGLARFRGNVFNQRGAVGAVYRLIPEKIRTFGELGLPPVLATLAERPRGLVLITGPTGSGKSTTLAAMLDKINSERHDHILTIEDPIEYLHSDKQSIVSQREVGTDTREVAEAVRRALRQGPDVLVVSDVVDLPTLQAVLAAASTGHLVLATMPTTSTTETVTRVVDFFPPHQQKQARHALAGALRLVLSQRLLERADGKGRTAAFEVLVNTPKVYDCIVDPERHTALERLIAEGEYHGMQTFDQALFELFKNGLVSLRDALSVAAQPEELRLQLQQAGLSAVH
jgi:twitching motility protein PilT